MLGLAMLIVEYGFGVPPPGHLKPVHTDHYSHVDHPVRPKYVENFMIVARDDQTGVDNVAGGAGSSSSYNISTGGIVAIAVIVALVAIFGIASAVLFYLAKKRGWEVRKSLKRMSRRMTGRKSPIERSIQSSKRGAVRMASPPRSPSKSSPEKAQSAAVSASPAPTAELDDKRTRVPGNDQNGPHGDLKKWKAIVPPGWSIGGRRP